MGCDIHMYKEKQVGGLWLAADEWTDYDYGDGDSGKEVSWQKRFTDRNYVLFGLLSKGVRTDHDFSFESRGLPFNASIEVAADAEHYGVDGHSHSYLYLHELRDMAAHLKTVMIRVGGMKDKESLAALQASIDSGSPNWDLVFPYCAWSSSPESVEFEQDVPADFYMGAGLQKIIDSFDGVDGDNHRVVFWFDN